MAWTPGTISMGWYYGARRRAWEGSQEGSMATLTVGKRPELTKEQAIEDFKEGFSDCKVYPTRVVMRDFIIERSMVTGVGVQLKQDAEGTTFVYTGMIPNVLVRSFGGLIIWLLFRGGTKMEDEVAAFIQSKYGSSTA
jgi:hypothetical protein